MGILLWTSLTFLNAVCVYANYKNKSYKTSMFACFSCGLTVSSLIRVLVV